MTSEKIDTAPLLPSAYWSSQHAETQENDAPLHSEYFQRAAKSSAKSRLTVFLAILCSILVLTQGGFASWLSHNVSIPDDLRFPRWRPGCNHHSAPSSGAFDAENYHIAFRNRQTSAIEALAGTLHNAKAARRDGATVAASASPLGLDVDAINKHFEQLYLAQPKAESAREALKRYTKVTHVAGTDADKESAVGLVSEWGSLLGAEVPDDPAKLVFDAGSHDAIRYMTSTGREFDRPQRAEISSNAPHRPLGRPRVWVDTYSSWLNYPVSSSLNLRKTDSQEAYWQAKLKEDEIDELPKLNWDVPVFHGYSKSGIASGPIVYAALCTKKDFEDLARKGVKVEGAITLCRYGGPFRGLKVRASADNGAVGTLIYSDPAEDNGVTEANGHKPYPDGPARQPSSVQRGSVQALSIAPGDPSTIGFPSYRNASRESPETADSLPTIPSLPISFEDAKALLLAVQGKGVKAAEVGDNWVGQVPGVEEYWTGPSEDIASLDNQMTDIEQVHDIWNTYAYIPGQIQDEIVMIGNHRDAWTYGAADPSSGTAALHEVVKGLGALRAKGWAPLRSIIVASWDAEEYGLVGSTEATEDYAHFYQQKVVAYLNCDVAVSGPGLSAGASPSLSDLLIKAGAAIIDPDGDGKETLKVEHPRALGSGSDYTGFLQHLGIASTDLGFSGGIGAAAASDFASPEKAVDRGAKFAGPVYHYHSRFDSFPWMEKFG
ncbi:Transferrin receptor and related proteins containing the protease-associated (PA) domain [Ceraceosorus bombacis]|uniref:Peptide hydrolase n=1 Tax=Ceraceosorus bombacis TaxID=401625 RepID=A0A0P1BA11_9BASI|nr:Transferrin receptor and related proteins containing the protease-associated (PA) domain [Ceraceosorus bombacis]